MKIKNIIFLSIIGIISLLYITEKSRNYDLFQQLADCKVRHNYHQQFFQEYLTNRKSELDKLKDKYKFTEEEKDWLEVYWEAQQENEENSFAQKQLARAKNKLSEKLSEKDVAEILWRQKEIIDFERQLKSLPISAISSENFLDFFLDKEKVRKLKSLFTPSLEK